MNNIKIYLFIILINIQSEHIFNIYIYIYKFNLIYKINYQITNIIIKYTINIHYILMLLYIKY